MQKNTRTSLKFVKECLKKEVFPPSEPLRNRSMTWQRFGDAAPTDFFLVLGKSCAVGHTAVLLISLLDDGGAGSYVINERLNSSK